MQKIINTGTINASLQTTELMAAIVAYAKMVSGLRELWLVSGLGGGGKWLECGGGK